MNRKINAKIEAASRWVRTSEGWRISIKNVDIYENEIGQDSNASR